MVISDEIKFPRPIHVDPFRSADRKVEAVDTVPPIARIGAFKREWSRRREGNKEEAQPVPLGPEEAEAIRLLVDRVNTSLEDHQIMLHLVLIRTTDGYVLDVYDCTGEDACAVVRDFVVALDDLPALLRNLEEASGLLIDTIS